MKTHLVSVQKLLNHFLPRERMKTLFLTGLMFTFSITLLPSAVSGLQAAYSFDEGIGTTAGDVSGNNYTGTLVNGPTWTTGKIEGAVSFDGGLRKI